MLDDSIDVILAKLLGASEEPAVQVLTLYIPDKDRDGKRLNFDATGRRHMAESGE
jgi:hypothetical protein